MARPPAAMPPLPQARPPPAGVGAVAMPQLPPPPNVVGLSARDLEAVYQRKLNELTFNSKPIINDLTRMAEQVTDNRDIVVALIVRKIDSQAPESRLPAIYVADSIMKNVGGDYPRLFAPHISRVFIGTYELSSEDVKRKLKHLLKTWEEAAMFSSETLAPIHKRVGTGAYDTRKRVEPPPPLPNPYGQAYPAGYPPPLLSSMPLPYQDTKRPRMEDPRDTFQRLELDAMARRPDLAGFVSRLRMDLERGADWGFVIDQLQRALGFPPYGAAPPPAAPAHPQPPYPPATTQPPIDYNTLSQHLELLTRREPQKLEAQPTATGFRTYEPAAHTSDFLRVPGPAPPPHRGVDSSGGGGGRGESGSDRRSRSPRPTRSVSLESSLRAIYDEIGDQCRTCGRRFPPDKMRAHLDWHFELNRREKDREARKVKLSRGWFLTEEEWSDYDEAKILEAAAKAEEEERKEAAPKVVSKVPAPSGVDVSELSCALCGEGFEQEWDTESEQWMLNGVVFSNGKYMHQKCLDLSVPPLEPDPPR